MQEVALAESTVACVGDRTLDIGVVEKLLEFILGVIAGQFNKLGPGVKVLQNEAIRHTVDTNRVLNNFKLIPLRGSLN